MSQIVETKLITTTSSGSQIRLSATLEYKSGRIFFLKSPYSLKDEIKAMRGSKWHGFDDENPRKIWSIEDCQRNRVQLAYLQGEDVYEWFDRPLVEHEYERPLMPHQKYLVDTGLTYHYQLWAADMGTGKSLAAQETIERSGYPDWFWVGPKTSIPNIKREFRKWGFDFNKSDLQFFTYEGLVRFMDEWQPGDPVPHGLIGDESSRCKTATAQRTKAMQALANLIREHYGHEGYVILMSGTPSPKTPVDWWSQAEIVWPGFLKEGSPKAMEQRLAFLVDHQYDQGAFKKRVGWKDDEHKCAKCGLTELEGQHDPDTCEDLDAYHAFEKSVNEVTYLYERLKGLVQIVQKKDCLNLPEKHYRKVYCKPSASTLRVAQALASSAPNTVTGLTLLRELSDGFQYREVEEGTTKCPHCTEGTVEEWFDPEDQDRVFTQADMLDAETVASLVKRTVACPRCGGSQKIPRIVRITREVPCPKEAALRDLLDENEETGRIVIFAGFTGSVDRITNTCRKEKWDVVRCDGRGYQVTDPEGNVLTGEEPLDYWANLADHPRVAFVAHPESGGMSLSLTEARMAVYWSNSFKSEYRSQSEDRVHRKGMDESRGATIVDLIHLPTDERVLEVLRTNRRLELLTMGDVVEGLDWQDAEEAASDLCGV